MSRVLTVAAILAVILCRSLPAMAGDDEMARLLARVNAFRSEHGLSPVALEARLAAAAQHQAEAMAASGRLSHDLPAGTLTQRMALAGYAFAVVAENIGGGTRSPEETVAAWIQSPGHARNLLLASVRDAGVGHAHGSPGNPKAGFGDYWSLILAESAPP
jgi:uncharacterized protein YkwD